VGTPLESLLFLTLASCRSHSELVCLVRYTFYKIVLVKITDKPDYLVGYPVHLIMYCSHIALTFTITAQYIVNQL